MTETKYPGEKLTVAPAKGTLTLKRPGVESGVVKQSFSHGRTKAVVVEKVKSRRVDAKAAPAAAPSSTAAPVTLRGRPAPRPQGPAPAAPATTPTTTPATGKPTRGLVLPRLTDEERTARASALESAKFREAEERK